MASLILRDGNYHMQWYEGAKKRRRSLRTDSLQIAKEKLRQFESAQFAGHDCALPTRTPVGEIVAAYIENMKVRRHERSWSKDIAYLRAAFGECCEALKVPEGRASRCRELRCPEDRRKRVHPIGARYFEEISTAMISDMIAQHVRVKGLSPTTANRYREVVSKVFNWAIKQQRVKLPMDVNPAARVERYRQRASEIRYLTLPQIDEQFEALYALPALQVMVAMLIYAGLRREELLWLRTEDIDRSAKPHGVIRIRAKTIDGESWEPKTARNRVVPISSSLAAYLDQYEVLESNHGWVFPCSMGGRWDKNNFSRSLREANNRAGLVWSCLDYRHTFGSQLAQKGVSLFQIATMMGNSPEICRRHYTALVPEAMAGVVEFKQG